MSDDLEVDVEVIAPVDLDSMTVAEAYTELLRVRDAWRGTPAYAWLMENVDTIHTMCNRAEMCSRAETLVFSKLLIPYRESEKRRDYVHGDVWDLHPPTDQPPPASGLGRYGYFTNDSGHTNFGFWILPGVIWCDGWLTFSHGSFHPGNEHHEVEHQVLTYIRSLIQTILQLPTTAEGYQTRVAEVARYETGRIGEHRRGAQRALVALGIEDEETLAPARGGMAIPDLRQQVAGWDVNTPAIWTTSGNTFSTTGRIHISGY